MNNADSSKAMRAVERAARAVRKHFESAAAAGMHPDEFWFRLGQEIDPKRKMRPRNVSLANYGKTQRAAKGRRANQENKVTRNQQARAIFEVNAKEGMSYKSIYKLIKQHCRVGERRARDICKAERKAFDAKSRNRSAR